MSELQTGTAILRPLSGSEHLSISLVEMGLPDGDKTLKKMHAELNEDLLGNNKFAQGKKEFLGVNVFRRLLNEAFNSQWSWELMNYQLMPSYDKPEYALVVGRLYLPGLGFRDGVGTAKMDKKDNSACFAVATSNAFKNALKQSGFGASLLDDDWDEDLFDEEFEEEEEEEQAPPPKKDAPKKEKKEAPKKDEAPKKKKASDGFTDKQKEAMAELKEIYNIDTNKELLGFMQIWDPELKSLADVDSKRLEEFLTYYDENEDEFEDFEPEEVA